MVWYVSYGSNMDEDRFICYLRGERAKGSEVKETGCRDSSLFTDSMWVDIPHPLYFSKSSTRWQGGGVLFLDDKRQGRTIGKGYRITWEQFLDITKQECGMDVADPLALNRDMLKKERFADIGDYWYGRVLYLGECDGEGMYTFTVPEHMKTERRTPSPHYVNRIEEGLRTKGLDQEAIDMYIGGIEGR